MTGLRAIAWMGLLGFSGNALAQPFIHTLVCEIRDLSTQSTIQSYRQPIEGETIELAFNQADLVATVRDSAVSGLDADERSLEIRFASRSSGRSFSVSSSYDSALFPERKTLAEASSELAGSERPYALRCYLVRY